MAILNSASYNEKQKIELATAEKFFSIYNTEHNSRYAITRIAGNREVPDVLAKDENGNQFNLEVTLTEDRPDDIRALLGRGDDRSLETLKRHLEAVRKGLEQPRITSLRSNALPNLLQRIDKKLSKCYGSNTALVVRDTSPLWDWDQVLPDIKNHLKSKSNPFDLGIWLLITTRNQLFRITP
jgi:hypothetical protein